MIFIIVITFVALILQDANSAVLYEQVSIEQLKKNAPHLPDEYLREVEITANKYCVQYNIPCKIFKAILAVESDYNLTAYNKKTRDYGIGQINDRTIKAMRMEKGLLLSNLDYSIRKSAKVLSYFHKRYAKKEKNWFARYNVGTAKNAIHREAAIKYTQKVLRKM